MAKPFDATLNALIDLNPSEWAAGFARIAGIPPGPSTVLDTDLATSVQADKLFRIDGERPCLLHLELEANPRSVIPRELMRYNTLVDQRDDLPVETVLVLLRPKAFTSDQTGSYRRLGINGNLIAEFRYRVEKVWERSIDYWLEAGLALTPLALLTDEANCDLQVALDRFRGRVKTAEADAATAECLVGASYFRCGLRYDKLRIAAMYRRLNMLMEESTTYQATLEEGRSKGLSQGLSQGLRAAVLRVGRKRFGSPSPTVSVELQAITDPSRLERLTEAALDVESWEALLACQ